MRFRRLETGTDDDKLKFGAHCYLFTDRWSDECLPILDLAAAEGLECVDIAIGDDVVFRPEIVRRRAEALGLDLCVSPGGYWPEECDLSADQPEHRALGLAWHQKAVDLASEIGAVAYSGCLYGHAGVVRKRRPPPDEWPRTAEGLHRLAEYGARRGVSIVLEPMSRFRTHLVNTSEQVVRLIRTADHPNLRVLLDTYHLMPETRDYGAAIREAGRLLWGIHACENDRGVPGGGLVPWPAVAGSLGEIAFDGYVILETYNTAIGDFAFRRGVFQNVCPDGRAFVRQALAFLRTVLAPARRVDGPARQPAAR